MYVGGNIHGEDGLILHSKYPLSKIHIYEPVPSFFDELVSYWKIQQQGNNVRVAFHEYGLGMHNKTLFIDTADLDGQGTFIMDADISHGLIKLQIIDAASEIDGIFATEGPVFLLHMNCEGCEWEFFNSAFQSNRISQIPTIQFSLHYLPLDRSADEIGLHYCRIHETLSQTHSLDFGVPFAWQRWTKKKE